MKKILAIAITILMVAVLSVSAFAELRAEIAAANGENPKLVHVSYDEVRFIDAEGKENGSIMCGGEEANILTPAFGDDKYVAGVVYWGWASANGSNIKGFSYAIDGGEKVTAESFKWDTEQAVIDAGPGEFDSRFKVVVPAVKGENKATVYVDYEDGTSEVIWIATATVANGPEKTADQPQQPTNPGTADASVIAIAAVACVALAGVVVAKKVR
jgi:hypothetical protein